MYAPYICPIYFIYFPIKYDSLKTLQNYCSFVPIKGDIDTSHQREETCLNINNLLVEWP